MQDDKDKQADEVGKRGGQSDSDTKGGSGTSGEAGRTGGTGVAGNPQTGTER